MPFNGSGIFQRVRNWVADATAGVKIRADYHDAEDDGFATGLTNCITKDGQTTITQNIPFNSKRITGLADPINAQDAATKAYADTKFTGPGTLTGDWTVGGTLTVTGLFTANGGEVVNGAATFNGTSTFNSTVTVHSNLILDTGNILLPQGTGIYFNYPTDSQYLLFDGTRFSFTSGNTPVAVGYPIGSGDAARVDWVGANYQPLLGFTPVQQGGAGGMSTNKVYIGWSGSGLLAQVDSTPLGAFMFNTSAVVRDTRLAYAGDVPVVNGSQSGPLYEPYGGAVCTGWQWTNVGYPVITYLRFRYLQVNTGGGFYTVAYA
jgi:hypothetical protein